MEVKTMNCNCAWCKLERLRDQRTRKIIESIMNDMELKDIEKND